MEKKKPIKVLLTKDNFVGTISISRERRGSAVVSGESIIKILEKNEFSCEQSKKIIDRIVWEFVKSDELEKKFQVHADILIQTEKCFTVHVSKDEMTAYMDIHAVPEMCGKLSERVIRRILMNAGVNRGIIDDNLIYIIKKYNSSPGHESGFVVAKGEPETFAVDGSVELSELFKHSVEIKKKPRGKDATIIDAIATDHSIPQNTLLLRIIIGQKGKEGFTITGKKIWHDDNKKIIKNPRITMNRDVREDLHTDHIDYLSAVEGRAFFIDNRILDVEMAVDGKFELSLNSDNMSCNLQLQAPKGGKKITYEHIIDEIRSRNIKAPIQFEDVKAIVDELNALDNLETRRFLLAQGTPPVNGLDEEIKLNANLERVYTPCVSENGVIDYRGGSRLPFVRVGEEAGILYPSTKGEKPGVDIFGKPVKPKDGKTLGIDLSESFDFIECVKGNREVRLLKSKISGLLVKKKNEIIIDPVFEADVIDYSTGSIDFDGTVIIKETVKDGFKVCATKDIHIGGSIGACTVESQGSVIIKGGINGRKKGRISADNDVYAKYAENCHVKSKGSIYIESHSLLSDLISGNEIIIGMNRKKGRVIGSRLYAWHLIRTDLVGSEKTSGDSTLWAGVNKEIYEELQDIKRRMDEMTQDISTIDNMIAAASKSDPAAVSELVVYKKEQSEKLEKIRALYEDLNGKTYNIDQPCIEILQKIQERSIVMVATKTFDMPESAERTKFLLVENKIHTEKL